MRDAVSPSQNFGTYTFLAHTLQDQLHLISNFFYRINLLLPSQMVTGRSVLGRTVRQGIFR